MGRFATVRPSFLVAANLNSRIRRLRLSSMQSRSSLRTLFPIVMIALVATGLGAGYYFASAHSGPSAIWDRNPLFLTFSTSAGSGNAQDSFTCNNPVAPVTLEAISNQPSIVSLTVSPSSFANCGFATNSVEVTAACTASAQTSQSCQGDFSGKLFVCGPTAYTCLQRALIVVITVTSDGNQNSQLPSAELTGSGHKAPVSSVSVRGHASPVGICKAAAEIHGTLPERTTGVDFPACTGASMLSLTADRYLRTSAGIESFRVPVSRGLIAYSDIAFEESLGLYNGIRSLGLAYTVG
jgi:hypothetical protein